MDRTYIFRLLSNIIRFYKNFLISKFYPKTLHLNYQIPLSVKLLFGLFIVILSGILFLGLNPKGFSFSNNIHRINNKPGITIGKFGIAYTKPFISSIEVDVFKRNGFSIEIALKPEKHPPKGFNSIIVLHNGNDAAQLLMGQWQTWIILMNGDDYNHKRKSKRISINTASILNKSMFVTITSGKEGTKIYSDGRLLQERKDLTLKIPSGGMNGRLIVGNSVYGAHSWSGDVYGLAIYQHIISAAEVSKHYNTWLGKQNFRFAEKNNPYLLYLFNENNSSGAFDYALGNHHLKIPQQMKILKRKVLSLSFNELSFSLNFIQDVILNLAGFIPLGLILSAISLRINDHKNLHRLLIIVIFGFFLSLSIEIAQSWIPSRSSSFLDLILNTAGTLIGVTIYSAFVRLARRKIKLL